MASQIIEVIRSQHQEIEFQIKKAITELTLDLKKNKSQIQRGHIVSERLRVISDNVSKLMSLYRDNDNILSRQMHDMDNNGNSYNTFLQEYTQIIQSHTSNTSQPVVPDTAQLSIDTIPDDVSTIIPTLFSSNEVYGRALELTPLYQQFISLPILTHSQISTNYGKNMTYSTYLERFDDIALDIPLSIKLTSPQPHLESYYIYLDTLLSYLQRFFLLRNPLVSPSATQLLLHPDTLSISQLRQVDTIYQDIYDEWVILNKKEAVLGWYPYDRVINHRQTKPYGILLAEYDTFIIDTVDNINKKSTSIDNNNNNNTSTFPNTSDDPLYCQYCTKTFAKQTVYDVHLNGKNHIKAVQKAQNNAKTTTTPATIPSNQTTQASSETKQKLLDNISCFEFIISVYSDILREQIDMTRSIADRKSTLTLAESRLDLQMSDDDDDEDDVAQNRGKDNTKYDYHDKLVIDGQRIPMWLYKLNEFHITYTCEVCGGDVFRGTRLFRQHFTDRTHIHMLKCLGITNHQDYVDIPRIKDVLQLKEYLEQTQGGRGFLSRQNQQIETEDVIGTVTQQRQ